MENGSVPSMREALRARQPAAPVNLKGPAILSLVVFFCVLSLGVTLKFVTGANTFFLAALIVAGALSAITYFVARKIFRPHVDLPHLQTLMSAYDAIIGRMYGWGYDAAAQTTEEILKRSLSIHTTRPQVFAAIDDSLTFLISRLMQIGQSKLLIGNEKDLKKHCDRLNATFGKDAPTPDPAATEIARLELAALELRIEKLEQISTIAVLITQELLALREACVPIWQDTRGNRQLDEQQTRDLLRQKSERAQRISAELAKIGL